MIEMYPNACKIKDKTGFLPIHTACKDHGNLAVMKILLRSYPNSVWEEIDGQRLLEIAKSKARPSHPNRELIALIESIMATTAYSSQVHSGPNSSNVNILSNHVELKPKRLKALRSEIYRQLFNYPEGTLLAVELRQGFFYEGRITELSKGWAKIRFKYVTGQKHRFFDLRQYRHWVMERRRDDDGGNETGDEEDSQIGLSDSIFTMVSRADGISVIDGTSIQVTFKMKVDPAGRDDFPDLEDGVRVRWMQEATGQVLEFDGYVTDHCWVNVNGIRRKFVHIQYFEDQEQCWSLPKIFITHPDAQDYLRTSAPTNLISQTRRRRLESDGTDNNVLPLENFDGSNGGDLSATKIERVDVRKHVDSVSVAKEIENGQISNNYDSEGKEEYDRHNVHAENDSLKSIEV